MVINDPRIYGADLQLLRDLQRQNTRAPGNDLVTTAKASTGQVDVQLVTGVGNLEQALLLRFLTEVGELAVLGHPDYGSRLVELIGELNTDSTRNLAKMYVLQALAAEPRVQSVNSVTVTVSPSDPTAVLIAVSLTPIGAATPLNLVFPFSLVGGPSA